MLTHKAHIVNSGTQKNIVDGSVCKAKDGVTSRRWKTVDCAECLKILQSWGYGKPIIELSREHLENILNKIEAGDLVLTPAKLAVFKEAAKKQGIPFATVMNTR